MMTARLDGNVLAGPLSEVFHADMTMADACCGGCGDVSVVARAMVEIADGTFVIRCHRCGNVMAMLSQTAEESRLDTSGLRWLGVPRD